MGARFEGNGCNVADDVLVTGATEYTGAAGKSANQVENA